MMTPSSSPPLVPLPVDGRRRVVIAALSPLVDGGAAAAKRVVGDALQVAVQLVADGHDVVKGVLGVRRPGQTGFTEVPLRSRGNDRFEGTVSLDEVGRWEFSVTGWVDDLLTWHHGLERKAAASDVTEVDLMIGAAILEARKLPEGRHAELGRALGDATLPRAERLELALAEGALDGVPADRRFASTSEVFPVVVDPPHARFAAWYELFPRSTGQPGTHGTFATAERWLPYVKELGFDVVYFPPVHPVGTSFRKGPNNTLLAGPEDPGSPWAIGAPEGGHTAVHPHLGTLEEFDHLVATARELGLRVALDIAFQCSPDHPWVREHPRWFRTRPDGTIQYAENPPKKYQDVYPFDFETDDWQALWAALRDVFLFWIDHGVTDFRVDNPHTKPVPFWKWCIEDLKARHPEVLFLSEAFTRPSLKYALARAGFSQGYTYFTWRTTADELGQYMQELTRSEVAEVFRPSFWPNTPDILPEDLQFGGRPAFIARLVLAATLSSHYGIYGPAFELLESTARPGSGEYLDSEKYQLKRWDLDAPHSLKRIITQVNRIRKEHPALSVNHTFIRHRTDNQQLFCFSKHLDDDAVVVVVNLDFHHRQSGWVELDVDALGLPASFQVHDLLGGGRYTWSGARNYLEVDPAMPAQIFHVRRKVRSERDFDYFL